MRKRYIFIFLLLIVVIFIIVINISLYKARDNKEDSNYRIINNEIISKKHCNKEVCFSDIKFVDNSSADLIIFKGYVENQTTTELTTNVTFVFDLGKDKISYSMKFENLKSFEKQYFEYHTNDNRLLDAEDYTLKVS